MNINYIIENDINFYDEINNFSDDDDTDINEENENICLISKKKLGKNVVELKCNHKFNLIDLFKEVYYQKLNKKKSLDSRIIRLRENEFICPYCRKKQDQLLPFVKDTNKCITIVNGVNSPAKYCMEFHKCKYHFKSGKNKGNMCGKTGMYYDNNIPLCYTHCNYEIMNNSIKTCTAILKSGKNKGNVCGCKIKDGISDKCKKHS